ncbi:hypothetical protein FAZ15_00805 [Sphingobacterium olei]|uniref:Uncharacterized protein n=1 Tax=Sphingobacterium olei TaxID=2571155 RepID=A0A4U0P619_9SPHI|nr:hypothetical protein [Sphingobacterium olei]TJZ62881.1 hypothetical protein FAZ15_00805 [Sphingobacterium olei]
MHYITQFTAFLRYISFHRTRKNKFIDHYITINDWSEGQVGDPSIDFSGHISVFGEESLKSLVYWYEKLGEKVWKNMFEQIVKRHASSSLNYALFAIKTASDIHRKVVKEQLTGR